MTVTQADREALAANLRRLRLAAGLTQDELATRSLLHRTEISRLENARAWPETVTAVLLCQSLESSLDVLLEGTFWTRPATGRGVVRPGQEEARRFLAAKIRRLRKAAGLTQKDLAVRSGLHRSEISALERAIRSPRASTLIHLCGGLNVSATELLKGVTWNPLAPGGGRYEVDGEP